MTSAYDVPSWAGKPPPGLHLDTFKDDKFIQVKSKGDEKNYFSLIIFSFFSRYLLLIFLTENNDRRKEMLSLRKKSRS